MSIELLTPSDIDKAKREAREECRKFTLDYLDRELRRAKTAVEVNTRLGRAECLEIGEARVHQISTILAVLTSEFKKYQ